MRWTVVCEVVDDTTPKGKNRNSLAVLLTDGVDRHEIVRVAFVRANSNNPKAEFGDELQRQLDKAQECAATINELHEYLEELRGEAAQHAAIRIRGILGKPSAVPA